MSFDDYANHIYQKYRLCVALAIIKTKPPDLNIEDYIGLLKSKMVDRTDDDDVTVCSDDFVMDDDDSVNILKGFEINDEDIEVFVGEDEIHGDKTEMMTNVPEESTQTKYYENSQPNISESGIDDNSTYYSANYPNQNQQYTVKDFNSNKKIDNSKNFSTNEELDKEFTKFDRLHEENSFNIPTVSKSTQNIDSNETIFNNDSNKESQLAKDSIYDSQKTILYTVHGFTERYTHYSQSQNEIYVPHNYLYAVNKDKHKAKTENKPITNNNYCSQTKQTETPPINNNELQKPLPQKIYAFNENLNETNISQTILKINEQNNTSNVDLQYSQDINDYFNEIRMINSDNNYVTHANLKTYAVNKDENTVKTKNKLINNNNYNLQNKETEPPRIYNAELHKYEQTDLKNTYNIKPLPQNLNETNISQNILKINEQNNTSNVDLQYSQDINDYFNEIHMTNNNNNYDNHENVEINEAGSSENTDFSQNINKTNTLDTELTDLDENPSINNENNREQIEINKEQNIDFSQQNNDETEMEVDLVTEENEVVIPYKVLEEFNKIKIVLRRGDRRVSSDGCSADSGYKSDSQIRSSNRSALQLSAVSLNQSAYCLFSHIMRCPLLAATRDITSEIALTLAQLIDKLHEEEIYPQFFEELLDTVDILIRQIYKGRSNEDCEVIVILLPLVANEQTAHLAFLNKDEFIQRLLLLNKSIHIQKHSITKITDILIKFHENATNVNQIYELTNIDEIENVSYLFHVLEILIKNYIKKKNISSQESSQMSQDEDKILKKSCITDIWRRKWNPNFREIFEGSRENRCVLKSCSEILNKIIVDCVHCYSLVAFSALKCFNSIQA